MDETMDENNEIQPPVEIEGTEAPQLESTDLVDLQAMYGEAALDPDRFLHKAKVLAVNAHNTFFSADEPIQVENVYIVWFAKTLQNWKALVSTDQTDGIYIEVTYNGHAGESYVDIYGKVINMAIAD
jgi:hypothetical protein